MREKLAKNSAQSVSELGEFKLIELLTGSTHNLAEHILGPGDDCAVLGPSSEVSAPYRVYTTDCMLDAVHFDLELVRAYPEGGFDLGYKLLNVSFSDIAAMGARPKLALLNLGLAPEMDLRLVRAIYEGIYQAAAEQAVHVLGGDTVKAPCLSLSAFVEGEMSSPPILRSGARPGDYIWLSGELGSAAAGLALARKGNTDPQDLLQRYRRPQARLKLAQALSRERIATAMLDVSDGLLQDLSHILEKSQVSALLKLDQIPLSSSFQSEGFSLNLALSGGDDYELLFTAPPEKSGLLTNISQSGELKLSCIGEISSGEGLSIRQLDGSLCPLNSYLNAQGLDKIGYEHFKNE